VRSRHRPERHFEVVAGKIIDAQGAQHRFTLARNGQATASAAFRQALVAAGVGADTPATVLCDSDAGLWRLSAQARCPVPLDKAQASASPCVTPPASAASSDTSATCWATSNATRQRWCPTRPGVGAESRSRRRS